VVTARNLTGRRESCREGQFLSIISNGNIVLGEIGHIRRVLTGCGPILIGELGNRKLSETSLGQN
jgi:hypothetical protein